MDATPEAGRPSVTLDWDEADEALRIELRKSESGRKAWTWLGDLAGTTGRGKIGSYCCSPDEPATTQASPSTGEIFIQKRETMHHTQPSIRTVNYDRLGKVVAQRKRAHRHGLTLAKTTCLVIGIFVTSILYVLGHF